MERAREDQEDPHLNRPQEQLKERLILANINTTLLGLNTPTMSSAAGYTGIWQIEAKDE
jgi:hypothetical protein